MRRGLNDMFAMCNWSIRSVFIPLHVLGLVLLQACAPMQIRDTQSGAWIPVEGGTLEVHRAIQVPAGHTRVFFQDGAVVAGNVDEFEPFCQIQITTIRATAQTIRPDAFTVTPRGEWSEEVVERAAQPPFQLAALRVGPPLSSMGDGVPSVRQMLYFRLHSPAQPNVRDLACGGARRDLGDAAAPTLQEIAAALGDYATLTPR
jgi:hypothetical protein